ncbi:MAG: hypothetical protein ACRCT1_19345 [Microcoleaceae cyanobacterium]
MATYRLFDDSMTVTGNPEQITESLYMNCRAHEPIHNSVEFMAWQKETVRLYSGKNLDITSFETFVNSLVEVGFLLPINRQTSNK